jgi:colicin import membrane protein
MTDAAAVSSDREALIPRPPGGNAAGAVLSVLVHAALLVALTTAIDWHSRTSDVVSAELWSSVPQTAGAPPAQPAPPLPTPAPPPPQPQPPPPAPARSAEPPAPEPDIAVERAKREKAEQLEQQRLKEEQRAKAEQEAKAQAERKRREEEVRLAKVEEAKLAEMRKQALARMMGEAGQAASNSGSGSEARDAGPSAAYAQRLAALIRHNAHFAGTLADNNPTEVQVTTAPGGTIIARRIVKSSGHPEWDSAVVRAIDRTARLPPDEHGIVPSPMTIEFRPKEQ